MKAIAYHRFGPLDVLHVADLPEPKAGAGEVVVALEASSVNVIDGRVRKGLMGPLVRKTFPKVPGADVAGTVVQVGEGVTEFRTGDPVFGATDPFKGGAFAERVVLQAAQLAPKPPELSFEQAATLPIAGLAALTAMRDLARLRPNDRVLIHGGSGAVGLLAIQIAKKLGAHVTAVAGTAGQEAMRAAGADACIDYQAEGGPVLTGPFEAIFNTSGAMPFAKGAALLAPAGRLVEPSPTIPTFLAAKVANLLRKRQHLMLQTAPRREGLQQLGTWAKAGELSCPIAHVFSFADAIEAIATMERGGIVGKVLVSMSRGTLAEV